MEPTDLRSGLEAALAGARRGWVGLDRGWQATVLGVLLVAAIAAH